MAKSTFEWPFSANEIDYLIHFEQFESPHFVIGSMDEFEWVIKFFDTDGEEHFWVSLELELVKNSNMKSIDVTFELSLVESGYPEKVLFSRTGSQIFDAGAKKSLICKNVFFWQYLISLTKYHEFTLLCHLKLNNCDGEMDTVLQKTDLFDFEQIFNNPKFSDFILRTKNCEFKVHKVILMAKSPVFALMFESNMKEARENFAEITDIDDDVLKELLRYVYCGKVQNMNLYAYELFKAADKYQLESLQNLSLQTLLQNLSIDNVVDIYSLADRYSNEILKNRALMYMKNNLKEIVDKSGFDNSSNKILVDVLRFISSHSK